MEEEIIYEIVDSIVNNQDKIIELTQKIEYPEGDEIFQKEILYKKYLSKNLKNINKLEKQKKINEINYEKFKADSNLKLENIEEELSKINDQIAELEGNNDENNNQKNKEFYRASFEKYKNIILNKENEEHLKILNKEYNKINSKYNKLVKEIEKNESQKNKLNELDRMLEEEKEGVDMKIIEYMSFKESYEETAKMEFKTFILENLKNSNNSQTHRGENNGAKILLSEKEKIKLNMNKGKVADINVYFYELNILDINKLGREMSNQIINLINYYIKLYNENQNNINDSDNSDDMNKSSGFKKKDKNYIYNILNENNNNNNLDLLINKSKIFYNKSDIKSLISILSSKIIKQIISFISSSNNYITKEYDDISLSSLFNSLNELIISFIGIYFPSYIKINPNNSSNLISYIKYIIKSFYYENVIASELFFINEEYKNNKKTIKNNIFSIEKNNTKLITKKDEYLLSKNQLEEKIKYLSEDIKNNYNDLSEKEMEYIKLNYKLMDLINERKKIKYKIIEYENEKNFNDEKLDNKIENLNNDNIIIQKNILTCQEEIKLKNKQYKMEIDILQKAIKEKFIIIKNQLGVYKKKYGDNMELYNKFVNRINETLRMTDKSISNQSDENIFRNTQSTFYKSNKKRNVKKSFFTPEKIKINNSNKNLKFY